MILAMSALGARTLASTSWASLSASALVRLARASGLEPSQPIRMGLHVRDGGRGRRGAGQDVVRLQRVGRRRGHALDHVPGARRLDEADLVDLEARGQLDQRVLAGGRDLVDAAGVLGRGVLGELLHERRHVAVGAGLGQHVLGDLVGFFLGAGLETDHHVLDEGGLGLGRRRAGQDVGRLERIGAGRLRRLAGDRRGVGARGDADHDVVTELGLDDADLVQLEAQRQILELGHEARGRVHGVRRAAQRAGVLGVLLDQGVDAVGLGPQLVGQLLGQLRGRRLARAPWRACPCAGRRRRRDPSSRAGCA